MATNSGILAWKIPWTEEPGSPWSSKETDTTEHARGCARTHTHTVTNWDIIQEIEKGNILLI